MTKEELYKVTDILNNVLSNYLRGSEAEEVIAKLEESIEDSELFKEEPVSEDLEEAAEDFCEEEWDGLHDNGGNPLYTQDYLEYTFKAGAKWQKEQFEKNRLKHCNSITNEQAELEQGFIDQHLDKYNCMPGFLDAIEYGIRLQKQQMKKDAIDLVINRTTLYDLKPIIHEKYQDFNIGDKVKLIIIKED